MCRLRWLTPALVVGAALWVGATTAPAQDEAGSADGEGNKELHLGAGSCAAHACHGGTEPRRNEHSIWIGEDQHAQAFLHLKGPAALTMARRLKMKTPPHEAPECLSCHATDTRFYDHGPRFEQKDGVSCELCHGGASRWLGPHATRSWKEKSAAEKAALGMRDLSTAQGRVQACVGCHVGGPGRVVDHDLIAAGHPPLFFDAAAFAAVTPHWTDEKDLNRSTWMRGQVANLAGHASRIESAARQEKTWPDYAALDCYSCHHDLGPNNPYARIDPPGRAGRAPLDPAFVQVLWLALGDAPEAGRLKTAFKELEQAYEDRNRAGIGAGARTLKERARALLKTVPDPDAAEAGRILTRIETLLAKVKADQVRTPRHLARQIAYAIRALVPNRQSEAFKAAYVALLKSTGKDGSYEPKVFAERATAAVAAGR